MLEQSSRDISLLLGNIYHEVAPMLTSLSLAKSVEWDVTPWTKKLILLESLQLNALNALRRVIDRPRENNPVFTHSFKRAKSNTGSELPNEHQHGSKRYKSPLRAA